MAKALQRRRGTTEEHKSFTGLEGELTIDTDKHSIRVHDGVTAGGHEVLPKAKNDELYAPKDLDVGVTSFNGSKGAVTYSAPVSSVNGQTGAVSIPTGHNVGEEWISYTGKIPNGGVPYCGQTVTRATYADLWAYAQAQGLVKTESEWQSWASSHGGNVPFYSSGNGSTTFRMPKMVGYVKGASSQSEAGQYVAEGLPNITGSFMCMGNASGAFVGTASGNHDGGSAGNQQVTFDASRSNSIFGNSDHVTPETSVVMFGVYAFGEITNTGSLNAETLANGLATIEANLEAKLDDGDKSKIVSWAMPDYSSTVSLRVGTVANFPCDAIGYVQIPYANNQSLDVTVNGVSVFYARISSGYGSPSSGQFFIPKGSTLVVTGNLANGYYAPMKGAK